MSLLHSHHIAYPYYMRSGAKVKVMRKNLTPARRGSRADKTSPLRKIPFPAILKADYKNWKNGEQMAKRADGGIRFRPVNRTKRGSAPAYSPAGTGCPAYEQAVENLYRSQNEEGFWTLMSALNYALELDTHVLVPLQTALTVHNTPAPWTEHPVPTEKADGLKLWTLRNDKGRTWLPLFTSSAAACADRSTSARPMADYTMADAMELALSTKGIDGVVLDPWSRSATLDGALLNGLLHAGHTTGDPGDDETDAGKEAARSGSWEQAVDCYEKAAELGSAIGLALLADCLYKGRGVKQSRAEALRMWKKGAEAGEVLSLLGLGDDCARQGNNGKALIYYRRARECAARVPDIEYMPQVCLRLAQTETRYTSRKKALALAAEAKQGFAIKAAENEPDARQGLEETEQLIRELTSEQPARPTAYDMESLQLD